jgi:hypothetical protein
MRGKILGILCLAAVLPQAAHAAGAPQALLGKSVTLGWSEDRVQRAEGTAETQNVSVSSEMNIYISTAGRPFIRVSRSRAGGRRRTPSGTADLAPGGSAPAGVKTRATGFTARSMTLSTEFESGARQIIVDFNDNFTGCQARIMHGKESGRGAMRMTSLISGRRLEVVSISVGSVSCSVREGNVFGGQ